jgi:hypothetical protein
MAGMPSPNMTARLPGGVNHHQQHHHANQRSPLAHPHPGSAPLLLSSNSSSVSAAATTAAAVFKREEAEADALHKLRQSSARLGAVVPPAAHNAHQPLRSAPIDIVRFGPDGEPFDASALRCPPARHNLHHAGRQGKTRGHPQPSRKAAASSNAGVIVGDSSSGSSSGGGGLGSEANDSAFFSAASLADSPLDRTGVAHSLPFANASDAETRHVLAGSLDRPDAAHSLGRMHVRPRADPQPRGTKGGVERGDLRDVYEHHHHNYHQYNYDSAAPLPEPPQLHHLPTSVILSPSRVRPLGTSPLARSRGHTHGQSPVIGGLPTRSMPMATAAFEGGSSGSASGYGSPSLGMAGSPTSSLGSSGSLSSLRPRLRATPASRPPPPASAARRLSLEEPGTPQRAMITISEDATIDYSGCETEDPTILSMLRAKARSSVAVPPKNDWLVQDLHAALTELRSQHLDDGKKAGEEIETGEVQGGDVYFPRVFLDTLGLD